MKHKSIVPVCLSVLALIALPVSSFAQLLGNGFGGTLYDINTATGAATNPRSTGQTFVVGITFDSSGNLYGLTTFASSSPSSLVRINPTTGASVVVGPTGLSNIFEGDIAYNPTNGNLYGIQDVPSSGARNLFRINAATGNATTIGALPGTNTDFSALAFNAAGVLYALDTATATATLYVINPLTAGLISSVVTNVRLGSTAALAFDPVTGIAYLADGSTNGTNLLYTLNTTTGVATPVGPLGITDLAGLAFRPAANQAVPDSGTSLLLLAFAFASLYLAREHLTERVRSPQAT
ncbi:MAG: VPDSG-CTERM sorting domain-containing protein [Chthoniobacterales bacterium]